MPTVAQKLCHDIVEPVINQSSTVAAKTKSRNQCNNSSNSTIIVKPNAKPLRFIHIDQKPTSKIKTSHTGGMTIIKSQTSILSLAETAVNTLVSGPLKCDNNCVTLVRKRNHQSSCKCGHKRTNFKASTKSIQTLNKNDFRQTDKACTHCIEMITCGTQLLDNTKSFLHGGNLKTKFSVGVNSKSPLKLPAIIQNSFTSSNKWCAGRCTNNISQNYRHQLDNSNASKNYLRCGSAKHWALSNYPTRGPDF